jgi:hypothetical protein
VGDDTAAALRELVDLAEHISGQFRPEFELGYWAGVSEGAERWYVRFEGDIRDQEFTVLGRTAADALRTAAPGGAKPRALTRRTHKRLRGHFCGGQFGLLRGSVMR